MAGGNLRSIMVPIGVKLDKFYKGLSEAEGGLRRWGRQIALTGAELTATLTVPILGIGAASLKAFADIESLSLGLGAVMGSAEAAKIEFQKLVETARQPGLALEQVLESSMTLQSMGIHADVARRMIEGFGKATIFSGKSATEFGLAMNQVNQILGKRKIEETDIKIIKSHLPALGQALTKAFGTTSTEVIRASNGVGEFIYKLTEAMHQLPVTEEMVSSLKNQWSNFKDEMKISLSSIGEIIVKQTDLTGILREAVMWVKNIATAFASLSSEQQRTILKTIGLFAVIGPGLKVLGSLSLVLSTVAMGLKSVVFALINFKKWIGVAFGPIGLVIGATMALAKALEWLADKLYPEESKTKNTIIDMIVGPLGPAMRKAKSLFGGVSKEISEISNAFSELSTGGNGTGFIGPVLDQGDYGKMEKQASGVEDMTEAWAEFFELFKTQQTQQELEEFQKALAKIGETVRDTEKYVNQLREWFAGDSEMRGMMGLEDFNTNDALRSAYTNAIKAYLDMGISANDDLVTDLIKKLEKIPRVRESEKVKTTYNQDDAQLLADSVLYNNQSVSQKLQPYIANVEPNLKKPTEELEKMIEKWEFLGKAIEAAMSTMVSEIAAGEPVLKSFGKMVLSVAGEIIKAMIAEGMAAMVAKSVEQMGLPGLIVGIAAAGALSGIVGGLISSISAPSLAEGGAAYGPTMALIGDNPMSSIDPEVVAPASVIRKELGMGGMGSMRAVLRGDDIHIAAAKAERRAGRRGSTTIKF